MTLSLHNDFEGLPDGAALTPANTGGASGNAFDVVNLGAGSAVASTSSPLEGLVSAVLTGGTASGYLQWNLPTGLTRVVARRGFQFSALPAATYHLAMIRSGSAIIAAAALSTAGKMVARIGSTTFTGSTSTWTMALNTKYYVEVYETLESATGAANGTIGYRILAADGVTQVAVFDGVGASTGILEPTMIRFGDVKSTGAGYTVDKVDGAQVKDPSSGWIGPYVAKPTAVAGPDQTDVESGKTVTLTSAGSSAPGGGALTYAWTQTGGPAVTLTGFNTASPTFVAPFALTTTSYTFSLVVTSGGQSSDADTVVVTVRPHSWWYLNPSGVKKPVRHSIKP